jgi:hypothetical protein
MSRATEGFSATTTITRNFYRARATEESDHL